MNTGSHLPAYVFFEQFVAGKRVLDLFPPDSHGSRFLLKSARSVVSVFGDRENTYSSDEETSTSVIADKAQLPFSSGSFDLVFFFAKKENARLPGIVEFLKAVRTLVGQQGIVCVAIPNRDARGFEGGGDADLPRYFDFERALRRQFPHVTMLASKPLHGGTVSSIGRGDGAVAPLLEDRLLPEQGEVPSHFLGVCSPRYQRVDESMIVQAPYELLADPIRKQIERLRSNLSIAMSESELRAREIEKLEAQVEQMKEMAERAEIIKHEKASALSLLKDAERQIETKKKVQLEYAQTNEKLVARVAEIEQKLFDAEHRIRKEEKKNSEAENKITLARKERENAEEEREKLVAALRTAKAETRTRQREVDDAREELAGVEADVSALRGEVDRQRRETFSARERATKLELKLMDVGEHRAETESFEAEIDRVRKTAFSDRERLERSLEEEHNRLLEEIETSSEATKRALELQKKVEKSEILASEAAQRSYLLEERLQRATSQIEAYEKDRRGARKARDEIARLARERSDEVDRYKHQMEILSSRAAQSEARATELTKQSAQLNEGLESTETKLAELKNFKKIALVEAKEQKTLIDRLTSELEAQGDENKKLGYQLDELKSSLEAAESKHVEIESSRELQEKLDQTALKSKQLEEELAIVKSSLDYQKEKTESKQIEIESLKALEEKLARATEKNSQFVEEMASAKSSLAYEKEQVRAESGRAAEAELRERKSIERIIELEDELDKAGDRNSRYEEEISSYKTDLEDMHGQILQLESALADAEDDRRQFKRSTDRLLAEMEDELLMVSDDLEKELRLATTRLEKSQGEIWELKEEIVRLRAHEAAAQAAEERTDKSNEFSETIKKQEAIISKLSRERDSLKKTRDKYFKAIKEYKAKEAKPRLKNPSPKKNRPSKAPSNKTGSKKQKKQISPKRPGPTKK